MPTDQPTIVETDRPADERWGFPFGVAGLWAVGKVMEHLDVSRATVWRLATDGRIRKGRLNGRKRGAVRFCKRSVEAYAGTLEA
jgi:predicted DNA-binding transcriptional regulator AlpA